MTQTAGYSGTPLEKKLGIKNGSRVLLINEPMHYFDLFHQKPDIRLMKKSGKEKIDFIHCFCKCEAELVRALPSLKQSMAEDGMIWISWLKKSAKIATDLTEDLVRKTALDCGLVDVKVCAVDENWSALKLVIRLKDRRSAL